MCPLRTHPSRHGEVSALLRAPLDVIILTLSLPTLTHLPPTLSPRITQGLYHFYQHPQYSRPPPRPLNTPFRLFCRVNTHSKYDYYRWTRLNECGYKSIILPDSPECKGQYFRICGNLTLPDVPNVLTDLRSVHDHVVKRKALNAVSLH